MATDVIMPKVDMDQETGTVGQWLKEDGDEVKLGEIILEIETDKVAIEVEAPASGILTNILVGEGETVPIATVIATILAPGEELSSASRPPQAEEPAPKPVAPPADQKAPESGNGVPITPVARNFAKASGVDLSTVTGTGPRGRVTRKDVEQSLSLATPAPGAAGKVYATPAARRIAGEQNVALASVVGTGPDGRIQAEDVLTAAQEAARVVAPTPGLLANEEPAVEVIPLHGKRRTIAQRLTASYQSTPHINFTASVDMTRFNEARAQLNAQTEKNGGTRISATALLAKIVAQTLVQHPWLNSSFKEGQGTQGAEIHLYRDVNLGIAVALEDGLIVPVVRDAANKSVAAIASEVKDLATRARDGQLAPAEVRDGTFTISNLGPFGVEEFTAIINPPQAAILAVGTTKPTVVPDEDGQIVVRPIMRITLAADHRVVDGSVAANFIADLKAKLESPVLLLL